MSFQSSDHSTRPFQLSALQKPQRFPISSNGTTMVPNRGSFLDSNISERSKHQQNNINHTLLEEEEDHHHDDDDVVHRGTSSATAAPPFHIVNHAPVTAPFSTTSNRVATLKTLLAKHRSLAKEVQASKLSSTNRQGVTPSRRLTSAKRRRSTSLSPSPSARPPSPPPPHAFMDDHEKRATRPRPTNEYALEDHSLIRNDEYYPVSQIISLTTTGLIGLLAYAAAIRYGLSNAHYEALKNSLINLASSSPLDIITSVQQSLALLIPRRETVVSIAQHVAKLWEQLDRKSVV